MVVLDTLIKTTKTKDLNATLKRAFSAIAELVVIDDREDEAILFLINRTIKDKKIFLDKASVGLLNDEAWRKEILAVTKWIHTHNIKHPYSKADGCIFHFEGVITHRKSKVLGYSKDSKLINKCQFLITEFIWNNKVTSLVEQFAFYSEDKFSLIDKLIEFGFPKECIPIFQQKCLVSLKTRVPECVHQYCKQICFYQTNGEPIAITPVVNTGTQRMIHSLAKAPDIYGTTIFHYRPSSIGSVVSACGGRVRCLCYPPKLGRKDHSCDDLIRQWRVKKHLLHEQVLFSKHAFNVLFEILQQKNCFSTYKAAKEIEKNTGRYLQPLIEELFSEISSLKSKKLSECTKLSREIQGTIEYDVINGEFDKEIAVNHFTRQIHEVLEKSRHSKVLAYEPALIEVFAKEVRFFLSKKKLIESSGNRVVYIHFEQLLAYGASCQSNPYMVGLPSLTTFSGFVDAFLSRLEANKGASFAIVLRRFSRINGHPLAGQIYKGHVVKNDTVINSQHCDMEFDLIIRLDRHDSGLDLGNRNLFRCLPKRFSGGVLSFPILGTYQRCCLHKTCKLYDNDHDLEQGIYSLPSNARLVAGVGPNIRYESPDEIISALKSMCAVLPVNTGFKFLGTPCHRAGAIARLHVYAEPISGLVKLISPSSLIMSGESIRKIFWSLQVSPHTIKVI